jgi:hypothetical protein
MHMGLVLIHESLTWGLGRRTDNIMMMNPRMANLTPGRQVSEFD